MKKKIEKRNILIIISITLLKANTDSRKGKFREFFYRNMRCAYLGIMQSNANFIKEIAAKEKTKDDGYYGVVGNRG